MDKRSHLFAPLAGFLLFGQVDKEEHAVDNVLSGLRVLLAAGFLSHFIADKGGEIVKGDEAVGAASSMSAETLQDGPGEEPVAKFGVL